MPPGRWVCSQPISYKGRPALQRDIANFSRALQSAPLTEELSAIGRTGQRGGQRAERALRVG